MFHSKCISTITGPLHFLNKVFTQSEYCKKAATNNACGINRAMYLEFYIVFLCFFLSTCGALTIFATDIHAKDTFLEFPALSPAKRLKLKVRKDRIHKIVLTESYCDLNKIKTDSMVAIS